MPSTDHPPTTDPADDPAAARGTIYGTLARCFDEPDDRLHGALADGSLAADLDLLVDVAGLDVAVPPFSTDDDPDLCRARFNDLFEVGYPTPPVPLYESEHVTGDRWNEVNLDLARAYDFFGVAVDESRREHHDHLVLELEFAAYLARLAATGDEGAELARRDFLDRHLAAFVESIAEAVADEVGTGVFGDVASFANAVVRADHADLDATLDAEVAP